MTLLLAACGGGTGDVQQLEIHLTYDGAFTCFDTMDCFSPETCPLDCGGVVSVIIVDTTSREVLDEACVSFDPVTGQTLDGVIAILNMLRFASPLAAGKRIDVEINVFDPGGVIISQAPGSCPRAIKSDEFSFPMTVDGQVPRYWGVASDFRLGDGTPRVEVPVGCASNSRGCDTPPDVTVIHTTITDVNSYPTSPSEPMALDVRAGDLLPEMGSPYHARFGLGPRLDYIPLTTFPAEWEVTLSEAVPFNECFGAVVTRVGPGATFATASCEGSKDVARIEGHSYYLDKTTIDQILATLGLATLPAGGLVIGRVVDDVFQSTAGATVVPQSDPTSAADVVYFSVDLPSGELRKKDNGPTDANGYFAIVDGLELDDRLWGLPLGSKTRCCDVFVATHSDGRSGNSPGLVGLIDDVIMSTVITIRP